MSARHLRAAGTLVAGLALLALVAWQSGAQSGALRLRPHPRALSRADAGRPHADHRHGAGPAPGPPARASRCLQAAAADHRPARRGPDRHRVRGQHGLQPPGRPRGLPRGLLAVGRASDSWNTAALDQLEAAACVDAARVFVTGVSNGGGPTARLACDLSGRLAGVASVAGGYRTLRPCTPERPLPVLEIHGTADQVFPYGGTPRDYKASARRWLGRWRRIDGCHGNGRPAEARARRDRGRLARTAAPRRGSSTSASTAGPAAGPAAADPAAACAVCRDMADLAVLPQPPAAAAGADELSVRRAPRRAGGYPHLRALS